MSYNKRKVGADYERIAGEFLERQGIQILEYNYRCRTGEIDIICMDGEYLVFCEVKYRKDGKSGHPLEAVDLKKQKVLSRCAASYVMMNNKEEHPCRFDVVGIIGEEVIHIKNAFDFFI